MKLTRLLTDILADTMAMFVDNDKYFARYNKDLAIGIAEIENTIRCNNVMHKCFATLDQNHVLGPNHFSAISFITSKLFK